MKIIAGLLTALLTAGLVYLLDRPLPAGGSTLPPLGAFFSPQKGFWQNAEAAGETFRETLQLTGLRGKAEVYFDERLVPHVYADNEPDAFFIQGYLHARYRLWQMDLQVRSAAGRLSEVLGAKAGSTDLLDQDIYNRRLGMVYAAEIALQQIEADSTTKSVCDAYTAGVNAYINSLQPEQFPLEYKLLHYAPEPWSNLKTALFLKLMAKSLAGYEQDFEYTNARKLLTGLQLEQLFPYGQRSEIASAVFPKDSAYPRWWRKPVRPASADSLYYNNAVTDTKESWKPDPGNGSNGWAVHGSKTQSGAPILCNDPHLAMTLPSIWYEMQISTPAFNVYGVSFPGTPTVVIGFNDSCSFGFTNAMRDVRDYYAITFRDSSEQQYWFDSTWQNTTFREEIVKVKNAPDVMIRLPMTVMGPVMYDRHYPNSNDSFQAFACRWKAHEAGNELKTFLLLDRARDSADFVRALKEYRCPGQNMLFATKSNRVMQQQQGSFPAKWYRQGDFVMPGTDSNYFWQFNIPSYANLLRCNPPEGYVSSANQLPYDTSYPYYLGGLYPPFRGLYIHQKLKAMQAISILDMQAMQTDNYNVFAGLMRPVLLKYVQQQGLNAAQRAMVQTLADWNLRDDAAETGATIFNVWYDSLKSFVYSDELAAFAIPLPRITESTFLAAALHDSAYIYTDDLRTPAVKEDWATAVTTAFRKAYITLQELQQHRALAWGVYKDSEVPHLLHADALGRPYLISGGGRFSINCCKKSHGPSWRMIVQLSAETQAYGIYPGGQSGNPGSPYYDQFVNDWAKGKYYKLQIVAKESFATTASSHILFLKPGV
jgi:penicillin amidase